jgi:uncharacterized repeat protein (TIGR03847 family)
MSEQYDLEDADHLAVAATGEPGQRIFVLQARKESLAVTLKVEKAQVAALVTYLIRLLQSVPPEGADLPPADVEGSAEPDFVVGSLAVTFDEDADRIILVAEEVVADGETASSARVGITRAQAAALAKEGKRLVEGGRPPCPFCGYPLDQRGHVCPRTNGAHPPLT